MPVKCPYCATNSHSDIDIKDYPTCNRLFLNPGEAWDMVRGKRGSTIHVMVNPRENLLIGGDWSKLEVKQMFVDAKMIEMCDPHGHARRMYHGIHVTTKDDKRYFVETNEKKLKAFEEKYDANSN